MYKNGSETISLEDAQAAAEFVGMEVQDWANEFGWSEEGKTTVPGETTPPTEPEKTETSAGESSSDDSLLESPGPNPIPEIQTTAFPGVNLALEDERKVAEKVLLGEVEIKAPRGSKLADDLNKRLNNVNNDNIIDDAVASSLNLQGGGGDLYPQVPRELLTKYPNKFAGQNMGVANFIPSWEAVKETLSPEQYELLEDIITYNDLVKNGKAGTRDIPTVTKQEILDYSSYLKGQGKEINVGANFINEAKLNKRKKEADLFMADLSEQERKSLLFFIPGSEQYNALFDYLGQNFDAAGMTPEGEDPDLTLSNTVIDMMAGALEDSFEIIKEEKIKIDDKVREIYEDETTIEAIVSDFESINKQIQQLDVPTEILIRPGRETMSSIDFQNALRTDPKINAEERAFAEKFNADLGTYREQVEPLVAKQEQLISQINNVQTRLKANIEEHSLMGVEYAKRLDQLTKDQESLQIADSVVGGVAKNWSNWSRLMLSIEDFVVGSLASLAYVENDSIQALTKEGSAFYNFLQNSKNVTVHYLDYLEQRRSNIPYTGSIEEGDIESIGDYILGNVIDGAPSIAAVLGPQGFATYFARKSAIKGAKALTKAEINASRQILRNQISKKATNHFTMPLFAVSGGGGEARKLLQIQENADKTLAGLRAQIDEEKNLATKEALQKEYDYVKRVSDMGVMERGFLVMLHGAAEPLAERFGSVRTIENFSKYNKAVGYKKLRNYFNPKISKYLSSTAGALKGTGVSFLTETAEEYAILTLGNATDQYLGKDVSILEGGGLDFFAQNIINIGAMQTPSRMRGAYGAFKDATFNRQQNIKHRQLTNDYLGLQADIDGLLEVPQTDDVVAEIKAKRAKQVDLLNEVLSLNVKAAMNVAALSKLDLQELISIESELRYLRKQTSGMVEGGKVADRDGLNDLIEQSKKLGEQRDAILTKTENKNLAEIEAAHKAAGKEAGELTEAIALNSAFEYNNALLLAALGENAFIIDSQNLEMTEETEQSLRDRGVSETKIQDLKNKLSEGNRNGSFYDDGTAFIFREVANANIARGGVEGTRAANVGIHELGHDKIRELGIITVEDGKEVIRTGDSLVNELLEKIEDAKSSGKMSEQDAKNIQTIIEKYKAANDGQHDVDELIQLVVDMKAGGYINDSAVRQMWQVKSFINDVYKKVYGQNASFYQLKNYKDVLNFIDTWQNSILPGKAVVGDEEESLASKDSKSLLEDINALVPETVKTQADFFDRKVFNPIYNDGKLHPAIANYIRSRSVSKEEGDRIIESVADRLINFNPEATRKSGDAKITFGEFLFANVNFGKLDARKALFAESQERAQTESTDSEQARQIATTETTTERQSEKPTYKNLLRRRVLEQDVVDAIKDKVKSTVRVMKTRIDQSVSKNVTVKPYIAEIKKSMGKQADIDVKKAMGGLKDGELRKFLLKNKAAILENMTTTYLMTAMPNAVQKSVNGQFTSDWKGKKIDREKVTTDNAGRTSGAELVRRLPNASTRLSDEDFLSNFFTEDGKLIRGRKESLAKAVAEEISFDIISEALQDPNSEIRKALEQRQDLLGVELLDNYVTQVAVDIERGNVKASLSLAQFEEIKGRMDALRNVISKQNAGNLTKTRLINALTKVFEDDPSDLISEKDIKAFANESFNSIKRYFSKPEASDVDFAAFVEEGNKLAKGKSNLMLALDIAKDALKGGYKALFEDGGLISRQRGLSLDFNAGLIASKGEAGLILALKWMRGHQTTSGKIGKGRMQIYAGVTDFIDNNLNTIPGVEVKYKKGGTTVITEVLYNGKVVENWKKRIESPAQAATRTVTRDGVKVRVPISKETFIEQYDQRLEAAREAWTVLTDYLSFVHENGNAIDWVMTMMSLKSNMSSMLKAAAPVKYYHNGASTANLRYEHVIPTEYMVLKLTQHFKGKAIDLDALRDKYNVAIIPIKMDDNFNILVQSQMNSDFDLDNDIEVYRYYNRATLGFKNMESIEVIGGDMKGRVIGESWVKFNESVNVTEAVNAIKNIKEIEESKPELRSKDSKSLSNEFNNIIQRKTGVESFKVFSRIQAQMRGRKKGRFKFFIAPGADDFRGLVHYAFAGKGKQGEADMQFFEDALMKPYFKGVAAIDAMRQQIKRDFKAVAKQFREEYKMLSKKIGDSSFTYDHALRVYMWNRQGIEVEGLSKRDKKLLLDAIEQNPELVSLADALLVVARRDQWPDPVAHWEGGSVLADLNSMTEKIGRKKFLEEFIQNADAIFTEENLNKIEATKGRAHREAIEDSLYAMKNGTNRPSGANRQVNRWLNWINGSTGAIMFFNRRSALLQMLSFTNFINWSDNNPAKAAAAFANQKQYWKDFAMIFNSDKLKERRGGLKQDVSDSELASVANSSKRSPQAILAYLLKIGFTPTQIADSMAIASGGAMFYRNRVNTYLKQGMDQKAAEEQAFLDFSMKSDEAQQSSDPALVSQEQRSVLGRVVLAFANTPMQYTRLMKKAGLDLINGRGNAVEHISKIAYYGAVQNFIFSALQSAMFALAFDDDEEELTEAELAKKEKKEEQRMVRVVNSMLDTVLRGSGVYGAVAATIKNTIMEYYKQEDKGFLADHTYTLLAAASISPPIQSKMRKIYSAIQTKRFEKDNVEARGWALTADGKLNLGPNYSILGNVLSGATNVPLDRVVDELKSISEALDKRNKAWQRIALALGWKTWDVGVRNEEADLIKTTAKEKRKEEGIKKAKVTRAETTAKKKATKKEAWAKYVKDNNLSDLDAAMEYNAWERNWNKK